MNLFQRQGRKSAGNALIYVLLALALLAGLTMAMMRQGDQGGDDISDEQAEIYASKILSYAATVKSIVDQMQDMGTDPANIDFVRPSEAAFATAPHKNKIYHPDGGGLVYLAPDPNIFVQGLTPPAYGWYIGRFNNVTWTPTTAQDIILTAYGVSPQICAAINKKILGNEAILSFSTSAMRPGLINNIYHSSGNVDFTSSVCPACDEKPAACTLSIDGYTHTFYSIILGR